MKRKKQSCADITAHFLQVYDKKLGKRGQLYFPGQRDNPDPNRRGEARPDRKTCRTCKSFSAYWATGNVIPAFRKADNCTRWLCNDGKCPWDGEKKMTKKTTKPKAKRGTCPICQKKASLGGWVDNMGPVCASCAATKPIAVILRQSSWVRDVWLNGQLLMLEKDYVIRDLSDYAGGDCGQKLNVLLSGCGDSELVIDSRVMMSVCGDNEI